ncbi:uncharacterized protein LOC127138075 [Lathyrus oleraceus]|uniref:uncharacterized protein LOC127138075 n=1 Tax=Pisum sativum TaxID=3888 RepID=UPI0021D14523|nr:uncharacterized protein LOC127138075 [Pisum sativum]
MSKQSSPKHLHVSTEISGSSSPTARANEPFQMINLSDLVLDVAPLSTIHPPPQKKATPSVSKNVKTSSKSFISEPTIPSEDKTVVEEGFRSKGSKMRNPIMHTGDTENQTEAERSVVDKELQKFVTFMLKEVNSDVFPDVQTYLAKETSPDGDSSEKVEESVSEHAAHERRSKKKADECIPEHAAHERRTKRLQRRKGKVVVFEESPSKEIKRKSGGMKSTHSRSSIGKSHVGPARSWSKVVTHTRKRKYVSYSDSEFESKGVALERELGKDALKCKEVVEIIEVVGLMKTVTKFGPCYKSLVKEFVVVIPEVCDDVKSADYRKVYVRGNVVTFSPIVINKFLGRTKEPQAELEVTNDQVCKDITAKQVIHWPNKGKLSAGKLSVKYVILHRIETGNWVPTNHTSTISTGLGKFIYAIGTRRIFYFGKYIFEQVLKQAFSTAVKMPIYFPSLICGIFLNQHPGILLPIDSVKKMESPLFLHYKLFAETRVPDIVMTSSQVPGPATSKKSVIAQLVCDT